MSAAVTSAATQEGVTAKDHAAAIAEHFRLYNEEFGRITRRAALNFLAEDWQSAQLDAVARIELYEQRVARSVANIAGRLQAKRTDVPLWMDIKRAYELIVARRPDSDFYRTFFQFRHARFIRHGRRQSGSRILRHQRRPRFRRGADPRLPDRRLAAGGGARDPHGLAVRRGDRRYRSGGTSHQRGNRPI